MSGTFSGLFEHFWYNWEIEENSWNIQETFDLLRYPLCYMNNINSVTGSNELSRHCTTNKQQNRNSR